MHSAALPIDVNRETAAGLKRVKELGETVGASAAQKAADWMKWRQAPHFANNYGLMHALGVHRDPSRGRTHIVFKSLVYTPSKSKDIRYKFQVESIGVFRIADVLGDIERGMNLNKGEGQVYIDEIFEEIDAMHDRDQLVPILDFSVGKGIETWLGSCEYSFILSSSDTNVM